MTRTILIHLNVEASDEDTRTPEEIADAVGEAISFVQEQPDHDPDVHLYGLTFAVPLVEELEAR